MGTLDSRNSSAMEMFGEGFAVGETEEVQGAAGLLKFHKLPFEQAGQEGADVLRVF